MMRPNSLLRIPACVLLFMAFCSLTACDREDSAAVVRPSAPGNDVAPATDILPKLSRVPDFSFTNEEGQSFGSAQLSGAPYLAAFMFTRCPTICPELTLRMKQVHDAVHVAGTKLKIVSISVDPENDTPAVLKAYAKKHHADLADWSFLTGEYKEIAKTAEQGFKVGLSGKADENKPDLGITHGSHLVLVDATGNIRGYFRSSDDESVKEIIAALKRL